MSMNKFVSDLGKAVAGVVGKNVGEASSPWIAKGLKSMGLGGVADSVGNAAGDSVVCPVVSEAVDGILNALFGKK